MVLSTAVGQGSGMSLDGGELATCRETAAPGLSHLPWVPMHELSHSHDLGVGTIRPRTLATAGSESLLSRRTPQETYARPTVVTASAEPRPTNNEARLRQRPRMSHDGGLRQREFFSRRTSRGSARIRRVPESRSSTGGASGSSIPTLPTCAKPSGQPQPTRDRDERRAPSLPR
jgi:hypothetical protein